MRRACCRDLRDPRATWWRTSCTAWSTHASSTERRAMSVDVRAGTGTLPLPTGDRRGRPRPGPDLLAARPPALPAPPAGGHRGRHPGHPHRRLDRRPAGDRRRLPEVVADRSSTRAASLQAPLGYNEIGQNIFLRLAKATQTSLIIGFLAVILIGIIGATVGVHRRLLRRLGGQPADAHRRRRPVAAVPVPGPAHRVVLRASAISG